MAAVVLNYLIRFRVSFKSLHIRILLGPTVRNPTRTAQSKSGGSEDPVPPVVWELQAGVLWFCSRPMQRPEGPRGAVWWQKSWAWWISTQLEGGVGLKRPLGLCGEPGEGRAAVCRFSNVFKHTTDAAESCGPTAPGQGQNSIFLHSGVRTTVSLHNETKGGI